MTIFMLALLGCSVSSCEPEPVPDMYGPIPTEYSKKPLAEEALEEEALEEEALEEEANNDIQNN